MSLRSLWDLDAYDRSSNFWRWAVGPRMWVLMVGTLAVLFWLSYGLEQAWAFWLYWTVIVFTVLINTSVSVATSVQARRSDKRIQESLRETHRMIEEREDRTANQMAQLCLAFELDAAADGRPFEAKQWAELRATIPWRQARITQSGTVDS